MTQTTVRLDVLGEVCPYPMLKAVEAMKKAKAGEVIEVLTDHSPALITVPHQAKKLGYTADIEEVGAGVWRMRLTPTKG